MSWLGPRRQAREVALQVLYATELNGTITAESVRATYSDVAAEFSLPTRARARARELLDGVAEHLAQIDERIAAASENWKVHRLAAVDRNILRVAAFELLWEEVPTEVVIDEAVEIARRFAAETSPAFVNGVLDVLGRSRSAPGEGAA